MKIGQLSDGDEVEPYQRKRRALSAMHYDGSIAALQRYRSSLQKELRRSACIVSMTVPAGFALPVAAIVFSLSSPILLLFLCYSGESYISSMRSSRRYRRRPRAIALQNVLDELCLRRAREDSYAWRCRDPWWRRRCCRWLSRCQHERYRL